MDREQVEQDHIAARRRHGHGIGQPPPVRGQVRRAPLSGRGAADVIQGTATMRAVQEPDLAVLVAGVVQMDQRVDVALVPVHVEGVVLVQRKGLSGGRRLDVHGRVMQFHVRPDQVGHRSHQARVGDRAREGGRVQPQVVHRPQVGLLLGLRVHVRLAPVAAPAGGQPRPLDHQPFHLLVELVHLRRRVHLLDTQEAVLPEEVDLPVVERSGRPNLRRQDRRRNAAHGITIPHVPGPRRGQACMSRARSSAEAARSKRGFQPQSRRALASTSTDGMMASMAITSRWGSNR